MKDKKLLREIREEFEDLKKQMLNLKSGEHIRIPAEKYIKTTEVLLVKLEEVCETSDYWELEYYRLKNEKKGE